jgi:DUF1016 N-terminal domain
MAPVMYGHGFAEKSLRRMVQFAATFREEPIVATLSRQLSWSHFVLLLPLNDPLQRDWQESDLEAAMARSCSEKA